jgi:hypothetical protein
VQGRLRRRSHCYFLPRQAQTLTRYRRAQQNKVLRRIDAGVTYSTEDEARQRKRKRI